MIYVFALATVLPFGPLSGATPNEDVVVQVQLLEDRKEDDSLLKPKKQRHSVEVDLTGVWYHLNHGDLISARYEIDRLRNQHLLWEPPYIVEETIRARTLFQSGRLQEAVKYLAGPEASSSLRQELSGLLAQLAITEAKSGHWTQAQALAVQAEDLGTISWNQLGWLALDAGEAAEALKFFDQSIGTAQESDALIGKLQSQTFLGQLENAENLARRIGTFDLMSLEIGGRYATKALFAAEQLKWAEALGFAENAGRLGVPVWIALGWVALENDRPDLALSFVSDKACVTDPLEANLLRSAAIQRLGLSDESETLKDSAPPACDA